MEIDHTNLGYGTSRREQARLHGELAQRERALRETHIKGIHEVEELKRAQEMRIDELSRQELREKSRYFSRAHITNAGVARKSDVPSQPAVVPSLRSMMSRDQSLRSDTWNLLGTLGNVFDSPLHQSIHHDTLQRYASLLES